MAKNRTVYVCQSCGHKEAKWLGRCPSCEEWSSLVAELETRQAAHSPAASKVSAVRLVDVQSAGESRLRVGISEFDRVLGGGLVHGGLVLVGGDPGIGKSTLLLQAVGKIAEQKKRVLYVSAEESLQQVKMRAERLTVAPEQVHLLCDTVFENVEAACRELKPAVLVVDSIQTVGMSDLDAAVGSVGQIRAVTQRLVALAKGDGISTFVVGHVTKDGAIAGPKVMEHMVDTVLYFEGDRTGPYRVLRAHKNRFGSAQEIGVFEMEAMGLRGVSNPSELFLSQRAQGPGTVVVTSVEGSRPILLEVQALTSPAPYGTPRRTTVGLESQRVAMLCAVLERHAGVALTQADVYVNLVGGVRINEPALDLGVVAALASATVGKAVPADTVVIGEVGLSGEVRAVSQLAARIAEATQLGFKRCLVPTIEIERWRGPKPTIALAGVRDVREALHRLGMS